MILRQNKVTKSIIVSIISSLVVIVLTINYLNIRIILEDIRETIHSFEPGVSRFISWDDSLSPSSKFHNALKKIPKVLFRNNFINENQITDEIIINMTFENYQKLLSDRADAIDAGILYLPQDVDATIIYGGISYKSKIRLKGDLPDHWLSQHRMSLRINLKNGQTIFGLNKFSIQKPRSRTFPYDSVFQKVAKKIGIFSAQHEYARVKFNGKSWGIMDIESHISKEFIESEKRKDSIVVRFSNEDGWRYIKSTNNIDKNYRVSSPVLFSKLYSAESKLDDKLNRDRYSYIVNQRLNRSHQLYDYPSYLNLLLLSDFWGTDHVLYENNLKHYFNPYTLKLEAISSDQVEPRENDFSACADNFAFPSSTTFEDINKADLSKYNIKDSISQINKTLKSNLNFLINTEQSIFPLDDVAPIDLVKEKNDLLSSISIQPYLDRAICDNKVIFENVDDSDNYINHVFARHYSDGRVDIFNLLDKEVEILSIKDLMGNVYKIDKIISGYISNEYKPLKITTNFIGNYDSSLSIITRHNGKLRETPFYISISNHELVNPLISETPRIFNFLISKDNKNWTIRKGTWNINHPLLINGNLKIEEGASLKFSKEAYLIVKGQLIAIGSDENKINLTSQNDSWKGLYVLNSDKESELTNISISNVTSVSDGILNLTGGVTFYKANVSMNNVSLSNGLQEDLLNIVESKYNLNNMIINRTVSDAIDFDFSEGKINSIKLFDIEGDALDFSGGNSLISNAEVFDVKDKAISAGEEATVGILDVKINDVGVGIASKDGSNVSAFNASIMNSELAPAMTYIKKSFYSAPKLNIESSDINIDGIIAQNGTNVIFDGIKLPTQKVNVEELYKSSVMKK